jgi:hypothetical protein
MSTEPASVSSQVATSIDETIEGLRWCRQHLQDRAVSQRMRQLQLSLAALALALDYEMDGQSPKAQLALEHADWRPRRAPNVLDPHGYWMHGHH